MAPCLYARILPRDGGQALARRRQRPGFAGPDPPGDVDD
jgi:hypothetical protein